MYNTFCDKFTDIPSTLKRKILEIYIILYHKRVCRNKKINDSIGLPNKSRLEFIQISAVKVNVLTQIHFSGTDFIDAACIFCPTRSWRNGDARCCQLSNIADYIT